MTQEKFFEWLDKQPIDDRIVRLRYKYSCDKDWIYSNEVLEFCTDKYWWLSDWWEGQQDVEILGCIPIDEVQVTQFK